MKDKKVFEWVLLNGEFLKEVVCIKQTIGNYFIAQLTNDRNAILDRKNFKILVSLEGWYDVPSSWRLWFVKGFIVVAKRNMDSYGYDYYIFKSKDMSLIASEVKYEATEFLNGKSEYFKMEGKNNGFYEQAIFYKDGKQVSNWYDGISSAGLVNGESDYYIASKNWKYAIFHKDGRRISDWYDAIYPDGLIRGQSDYYIADKNSKKAIFDKSGKQVTDWFNWVEPYGLVEGQSDYYIVREVNDLYYIYKLGFKKVIGPFKKIMNYGFIEDPSQNSISVITSTGQQKILTKQEVDDFLEDKEVENGR